MTDRIKRHRRQHPCKVLSSEADMRNFLMLADRDVFLCWNSLRASWWKPSRHRWSGERGFDSAVRRKNQLCCCFFADKSIKSRGNMKEHCCHSNLQFLICYLGEIMFFSKIFDESWIYLHPPQINKWDQIADFNRKTFCQQDEFSKRSFTELCWKFNSLCKVGSIHKFTSSPRKWLRLLPGSGAARSKWLNSCPVVAASVHF